ncbi:MAG: hypothetical protein IIZ93_06455, partial [Acidaminococcaceae bacterium]|nr:hypothetical protein [Acidaminococcaceae bacterium]
MFDTHNHCEFSCDSKMTLQQAADTAAKLGIGIKEMKLAAVHAIANLAKQPVPDVVNDVYKVNNLTFGRD